MSFQLSFAIFSEYDWKVSDFIVGLSNFEVDGWKHSGKDKEHGLGRQLGEQKY